MNRIFTQLRLNLVNRSIIKSSFKYKLVIIIVGIYLLIISIIFWLLIEKNTKKAFQEVDNSYHNKVKNVSKTLEDHFSNIDNIAALLNQSSWVNDLVDYSEEEIKNLNYLERQRYLKDLSVYNSILGMGNNLLIYFKSSQVIFSTYDINNINHVISNSIKIEDITSESFKNTLAEKSMQLLDRYKISTFEGETQANIYIRSLPLFNNDIVLIDIIDINFLKNLLYPYIDFQKENYIIYDNNGKIYNTNLEIDAVKKYINTHNNQVNPIEVEERYIYTSSLKKLNLNLCFVVDNDVRKKELNLNMINEICALIVITIIGIAVIWVSINLFYKRIWRINKLFGNSDKQYESIGLLNLEENIKQIIQQEQDLKNRIHREGENIKRTYIRLLLESGMEHKEETVRALEFLNISLTSQVWVIVLFQHENEEFSEKVQEFCKKEKQFFETVNMDKYSVILVYDQVFKEAISSYCNSLLQSGKYNKVACGISRKKGSAFFLKEGFEEGKFAARLAFLKSEKNVVEIELVNSLETITFNESNNQLKVSSMIMNYRYEEFAEYIEGLLKLIMNENYNPYHVEGFFRDLWACLKNIAISVDIIERLEERLPEDPNYLELCEYTKSYAQKIMALVEVKKNKKSLNDYEIIIKYVNDNIANKDLSLKTIANQFNVSTSYISRFFSENVGLNFHSYVQKRKIEVSKKLMKETAYSINEICEMSGFDNIVTFRRIFKKEVGMTPSDYKSTIEQ